MKSALELNERQADEQFESQAEANLKRSRKIKIRSSRGSLVAESDRRSRFAFESDHSTLSHSFKKYQAGLKLKKNEMKPFSNKTKKNHLKLQKNELNVCQMKKNQKP